MSYDLEAGKIPRGHPDVDELSVSEFSDATSADQPTMPTTKGLEALKSSGLQRGLRLAGFWEFRFSAGALMGAGAALTATGVGAGIGVPLMIAGAVIGAISTVSSAVATFREAKQTGQDAAKAVGKDLAKSAFVFVVGGALAAAPALYTLFAGISAFIGLVTVGSLAVEIAHEIRDARMKSQVDAATNPGNSGAAFPGMPDPIIT